MKKIDWKRVGKFVGLALAAALLLIAAGNENMELAFNRLFAETLGEHAEL